MKFNGLITVRTNSNRLKKKCLLNFGKVNIIEHVITRALKGNIIPVVCTTQSKSDDIIVIIAKKLKVKFFRGSNKNKIKRWHDCAKKFNLKSFHTIDAELVCKYKKIRKAIPAISLATDTSILTSIGNDMDFKFIFSRQIEAIGKKGDIAIAITTSGNSNNLIEATKVANKKGILTFCFTGNSGGRLKKYVNYPILIPSKTTSQIQVAEILLGQVYCEFLESNYS